MQLMCIYKGALTGVAGNKKLGFLLMKFMHVVFKVEKSLLEYLTCISPPMWIFVKKDNSEPIKKNNSYILFKYDVTYQQTQGKIFVIIYYYFQT